MAEKRKAHEVSGNSDSSEHTERILQSKPVDKVPDDQTSQSTGTSGASNIAPAKDANITISRKEWNKFQKQNKRMLELLNHNEKKSNKRRKVVVESSSEGELSYSDDLPPIELAFDENHEYQYARGDAPAAPAAPFNLKEAARNIEMQIRDKNGLLNNIEEISLAPHEAQN